MKQKGVTLLETILVLSLIAIIMIGGLSIYSNARTSMLANKLRQQVIGLASGVKSSFRNDYSGLIDGYSDGYDALKNAGVIPKEMYSDKSASGIQHIEGGEVYLFEESLIPGESSNHFAILFQDISEKVCYKFVTQETGARYIGKTFSCVGGGAGTSGCVNKGVASFTEALHGMSSFSEAKILCLGGADELYLGY